MSDETTPSNMLPAMKLSPQLKPWDMQYRESYCGAYAFPLPMSLKAVADGFCRVLHSLPGGRETSAFGTTFHAHELLPIVPTELLPNIAEL
jgi:hypothetical protein